MWRFNLSQNNPDFSTNRVSPGAQQSTNRAHGSGEIGMHSASSSLPALPPQGQRGAFANRRLLSPSAYADVFGSPVNKQDREQVKNIFLDGGPVDEDDGMPFLSDFINMMKPDEPKLMAYLPIKLLNECGLTDISTLEDVLKDLYKGKGELETFVGEGYANPSLYIYDKTRIQRFLSQDENWNVVRRNGWLNNVTGQVDSDLFVRYVAQIDIERLKKYAQEEVIGCYLNLPENKTLLEEHGCVFDKDEYDPGGTDAYRFSTFVEDEINNFKLKLDSLREQPPTPQRSKRVKSLEKLFDLMNLVKEPGFGTGYDMEKILEEMERKGVMQSPVDSQTIGEKVQRWKNFEALEKLIAKAFNDPYAIEDSERIDMQALRG